MIRAVFWIAWLSVNLWACESCESREARRRAEHESRCAEQVRSLGMTNGKAVRRWGCHAELDGVLYRIDIPTGTATRRVQP